MSDPLGTWPPLPPHPPEPPVPRRTPWLPDPHPPTPAGASASASLVVGPTDWLAERMLEQRMVGLDSIFSKTSNREIINADDLHLLRRKIPGSLL